MPKKARRLQVLGYEFVSRGSESYSDPTKAGIPNPYLLTSSFTVQQFFQGRMRLRFATRRDAPVAPEPASGQPFRGEERWKKPIAVS